jgi:hypothetical protein
VEILIVCLVAAYVVKNGVVDAAYAVRGKPSPRQVLARQIMANRAAKAARRAESSVFRRHLRQLWDDSWDEARERHVRRVDKRRARHAERAGRPPGALHRYAASVRDGAWAAWDKRWDTAAAKHRERRMAGSAQALAAAVIDEAEVRTRHDADQVAVTPAVLREDAEPGRPRDVADKPGSAETTVEVPDHPAPSPSAERSSTAGERWVCPECGEGAVRRAPKDLTPLQRGRGQRPSFSHRDGTQLCPVVEGPDGYRPAHPLLADDTHDDQAADSDQPTPDSADQLAGGHANPSGLATVRPLQPTTQEEPSMTVTTGETTTLSQTLSTIQAWEVSSQQAIASLETSIASLQAAEVGASVTGPLGQALEAFGQALAHFQTARAGLDPSVQIGDMYNSHPDAGDKNYVTS